jgi:predicted PurR-regulated permease PerM
LATSSKTQERLGAALFYGVVLLLAYLVYRIFAPFLAPLAWAGVLVVVFYPWHARLERRAGRATAAALSTAGVTLILIVPVLFLMAAFIREGVVAARSAEQALASGQLAWANEAWAWISQRIPGATPENLATFAREGAQRAASLLAAELGTALRNIAHFIFDLAVVILAMFYLFRDADTILGGLRRALPFEESHRERMIGETRDLIFASVTSSLVAALVHGLVGGIAFAVLGLSAALFWGVVMAFCSFVPLVGSALIWVPAAIGLMVGGRVGAGIFLLAFCGALLGFVDNVVRPWLISGRARLSGLLVFISVVGGLALFGLLGIVLGPIVLAMAASVLDLYTSEKRGGAFPGDSGEPIGKNRATVLE